MAVSLNHLLRQALQRCVRAKPWTSQWYTWKFFRSAQVLTTTENTWVISRCCPHFPSCCSHICILKKKVLTLICWEVWLFGLHWRHCAVKFVSQRWVSQAYRRLSVHGIDLWWINGFTLEGNKAKMCVIIIYFLYRKLDTLNAWQVKGTQPCCVSPLRCKANRTWCNSDHLLLCIRGLQFSQISKIKLTSQDGIHSQSRACFLVVNEVTGLKSTSATPAVKGWGVRKRQVEASQVLPTQQMKKWVQKGGK